MVDFVQFVAGGSAEVGIQSQYLDGELYFVNDTLPSRLISRPKLEIGKFVVESIAILVMHAFKFCKWAIQMFRHYVAMLKNFAPTSQMHPHVTRRMHMTVGVDRAPRATFPAAFLATKFLTFIVARVATVFGLHQSAFFGNAAQLALKSWSGFLVHIEQ